MKISEILKAKGVFSKDIKQRFTSCQIKFNGVVTQDIDVEFDIENCIDLGDFVFNLCRENKIWCEQLKVFGIENFISGDLNFENDLTHYFAKFSFLQYSKRDCLICKKHVQNV